MSEADSDSRVPVLLVDDRRDNLVALDGILGDLGLELVKATSGTDALRQTLRRDFALVLLDVQMPVMDGFATAELMRAHPKTQQIPIIFVTAGVANEHYAFKGYELGAVDYLTKPIEPLVLRSKVRVFCDLYQQRRTVQMHERHLESVVLRRTEQLRASEARLLEAQRLAQLGNWEWIPETNEITWCDVLYSILGADRQSQAPRWSAHASFFTEESWARLSEARERILHDHAPFELDLELVRPEGEHRWVIARAETKVDERGQVLRLRGTLQDITARKTAERKQRELEQQLVQSQKMETIGQLASGIAHDFNNILMAISGYADLAEVLSETQQSSILREYLNEIRHAGSRARELTAQMLAFGRADPPSTDALVHVGPAVKEVVALLQAVLPVGITLETDLDRAVPPVRMSPVGLHQIVMNLCVNARDAMDGSGCLTLRVARDELASPTTCTSCGAPFSGPSVVLEISDTGPGVPANIVSKAFDPFFTTKAIGKGSGLGLSVVHGLVHGHGGHVHLTDMSPHGALFRICFPAIEETDHPPTTESPTRVPSKQLRASIFVVDDEVSIGRILRNLLRAFGCEVTTFSQGETALAAIEENPAAPDVLLTDLTMPGMDGLELVKRAWKIRPDLPVIVSSGTDADREVAELRREGWCVMLPKPFARELLHQRVTQALAREDIGRERETAATP